jgi:hypothetical protein
MSKGGIRGRWKVVAALVAVVIVAAACDAIPGDFTGTIAADNVYEDLNSGNWYLAGQTAPLWTGQPNDIPVAGDYDGNHKWEPAVLRGTTWISSKLANPIDYDPAGMPAGPPGTPAGRVSTPPPTLLPVPGDYDGTGKTQPAYYDQVDGTWWIMGHDSPVQFGIPPVAGGTLGYDVPAPADYDGDGKTDIAVFRPTDNTFHYLSSQTGQEVVIQMDLPAGVPAGVPMPADYDDVGHAQAAVSNGVVFYVDGHTDAVATFHDGPIYTDNYEPVAADFDGDHHADPALFDDADANLWLPGQAQPPQTGYHGPIYAAGALPYAVLVNIVRVTLYGKCVLNPSSEPPGEC